MVPLIEFIVYVIQLYIWVIIASAIFSWLIAFNVVNTSNRFVYSVAETLYRVTEPALAQEPRRRRVCQRQVRRSQRQHPQRRRRNPLR